LLCPGVRNYKIDPIYNIMHFLVYGLGTCKY